MTHPAFQLWTVHQSTSQATVLFYVPRKTRSADLQVHITQHSITAGIKHSPPVINAALFAPVRPESSSWQIERIPRSGGKSRKSGSSRHRRLQQQASTHLLQPGGVTTSPRLSSGPPSTSYSIIGDSAPGSQGVRSASDPDSASGSESGNDSTGYISQPEDGSSSGAQQRRRLPRFDPSATRSFSSRSRLGISPHSRILADVAAATATSSSSRNLTPSTRGGKPEQPGGGGDSSSDGPMVSSVASLPARLQPQPHSAAGSRLASRSGSTTSFSSLGSAGYEMDIVDPMEMLSDRGAGGGGGGGGPGALASSTSSISSDLRRARFVRGAGEVEDLSQSQDSFLSIGIASSRGSAAPAPVTSTSAPHRAVSAADPTPMAERAIDDLFRDSDTLLLPRPSLQQAHSNVSTESRSGSGSGSGGPPSSNLSGSLVIPPCITSPSAPASTSAESAASSSGLSASSLAGARLVTIYLDKLSPGIWPVLISGPAPLPDAGEYEGGDVGERPSSGQRLPSLDEHHARLSLRAALQEALDESRSSSSSTPLNIIPDSAEGVTQRIAHSFDQRRDSSTEIGDRSILSTSVGSDDSDTVLGARFSNPTGGGLVAGEDDEEQDETNRRRLLLLAEEQEEAQLIAYERQAQARERQLCAKYNLDATSLVLLGLQAHAREDDLGGGGAGDHHRALGPVDDEAFHYLSRAWRAALSPIATCLLVEDYLPLGGKSRVDYSSSTESSDVDVEEQVSVAAAEEREQVSSTTTANVEMNRLQQSGDTLRSPQSGPHAFGTTSPPPTNPSLTQDSPETRRKTLISLLGGSNALGRLYLSYARLHLEVSLEKWTSPLAFPGEAGQLHGPYASSAGGVGVASPGGGGGGMGGASSPGVHFSSSGVGAGQVGHFSSTSNSAGLGLGGWSQGGGGVSSAWEGGGKATFGPATFGPSGPSSSSARSPSSVHSGRSVGSHSPSVPLGGGGGAGLSAGTEQTSILVFASQERERTLRRRPGPLAYMQAAVRLDPTLATVSQQESSSSSPSRPVSWPLLPGEKGAQAWRMGMAVEEDEWTEAHELEVERRAVLHREARYRASLTSGGGMSWKLGAGGSDGGTATPTSSSVPSSEVGYMTSHQQQHTNPQQVSRAGSGSGGAPPRPSGPHDLPSGPRRSGTHKSSSGARASGGASSTTTSGGGPSSSRSGRKPHSHSHSRRHGRSSMRRSTLPLISEEGMINIMSGAAVLSVVVAGSVAVMGWWRRAGGGTGTGV
ncbi:hypothetical protein CF327_g2259 [Tilletia walkeri]|uniref:CS domain-containing protein n=1 Tax=Tilletia walkeri TaxID=117179 RepID=A0A8X7N8Y4_9BASI|nr:hypothetical protein CF327_g2259 [Tilletia walkeri]KAE8268712.1 hypothetical protein A4X09_0g3626 [Tilletia walkeri]